MRISILFHIAIFTLLLAGCGRTELVYTVDDEIRAVKDNGTDDRRISRDSEYRGRASWRPGRSEVVFPALRNTPGGCISTGLFEVSGSGGSDSSISRQRCSSGVQDCDLTDPDVSKQGNILATQVAWIVNPACESTPGRRIVSMSASGTNIQLLQGTGGVNTGARWSPKGDFIVFEAAANVFTMDSSGQNACQVTSEGGVEPSWGILQGEDAIAFISFRDGNPEVYIATVADGSPTSNPPVTGGSGGSNTSGRDNCPTYDIRRVTNTPNIMESSPVWVTSFLAVINWDGSQSSISLTNPLTGEIVRTLVTKNERVSSLDW